jgi:hypothetical protein
VTRVEFETGLGQPTGLKVVGDPFFYSVKRKIAVGIYNTSSAKKTLTDTCQTSPYSLLGLTGYTCSV